MLENEFILLASPADGTPRIVQPLSDMTIVEGQPLKLSCGIVGLQVTINWFHNGKVERIEYSRIHKSIELLF